MVNIGIIGAGRIGQIHAKDLLGGGNGARITAIADPFLTDATASWAKSIGIENAYKDHRRIIDDKTIDAVLICSSTDTHSPISIEAIKAGKHVFCEKPIDHELSKINEVLDALKGTGLKYQVGFQRRFDHNFRALKNAVDAGTVGDIHVLRVTSRDPQPPPIAYVKVSGGLFLDMMIHDFDMVRFLTGAEAVSVYANAAVLIDPAIGEAGDVDTAIVTMKLSNGALAVIDNSRKAAYGYDQRVEVFGTKGALANGNDTESNVVFSGEAGIVSEKPLNFFLQRYAAAYRDEVLSFVDAIVNDKPTLVDANDGLQPVRMGLAAKLSYELGRPVMLDEI